MRSLPLTQFASSRRDANRAIKTAAAALLASPIAVGQTCNLVRASLDVNGVEVSGSCDAPSVSASGRFVSFWTKSSMVPQGTNGAIADLYVVDLDMAAIELISIAPSGQPGNAPTQAVADFSPDGRFVTFTSLATNLTPGLNNDYHAFLRDRVTAQTTLVSVKPNGSAAFAWTWTAVSEDGRFVAFSANDAMVAGVDNNGVEDVYVRDVVTGTNELVSATPTGVAGNSWSSNILNIDMCADARFVCFCSHASNLVVNDTNGTVDVWRFRLPCGLWAKHPSAAPA